MIKGMHVGRGFLCSTLKWSEQASILDD